MCFSQQLNELLMIHHFITDMVVKERRRKHVAKREFREMLCRIVNFSKHKQALGEKLRLF